MTRARSLSRRLALLLLGLLAALWLVSVLAMAIVLSGEQEELYDEELRLMATGFLPVLSQAWEVTGSAPPAEFLAPQRQINMQEALIYRLMDRTGATLLHSPGFENLTPPAVARPGRIDRSETHAFYTTPASPAGYSLQLAHPLAERREAYRETLLAFLVPMLAMLPLGSLAIGWVTRTALRPLEDLRREIAARDGRSLAPVGAAGTPVELVPIVATLNGFIARLDQALEGERAFATNAAHELRTPVAVALAQVQRLREEVSDPAARPRIEAVEGALKRMTRLVTRLLQLARADAGLGAGSVAVDAAALLRLVVSEGRRDPGDLIVQAPDAPVLTRMDADAFAIVAGNLIDNAFQHRRGTGPVHVTLAPEGILAVANDAAVIDPGDLGALTSRFRRGRDGGFGLGLHICAQILRQAGGRLELLSPRPGQVDGFEARAILPT